MIVPAPIVAAASAIAGVPIQVVCRPSREMLDHDLGFVYIRHGIPDHTIVLDAGVCRRLAHPRATFDALDMLVVAHEASHIALASTDECVVQQSALKNLWQVVRRFRLPAWLARWELANASIASATRLPASYNLDPSTGACPA